MDASLDDGQVLLVQTAAQLAAGIGAPVPTDLPTDADRPEDWAVLAGTGLLGMHLPEEQGGGGSTSSDLALVVEQLGRELCLAPFLGQGALAPELAGRAGTDPATLAAMASGSRRTTVALTEDLGRLARLGEPALAWDARGATHALVLDADARVVEVPLTGPPLAQADLTRVAVPVGADALGEVIGGPVADDDLVRWQALALALVSADLVGIAQGALDAAVAYVGSRQQFGVAVGTFQAVQHLAADAAVAVEAARASMWHAAWAADELDPDEALLAARQAKVMASDAGLHVVEAQTQMLGGIAITWEERAHLRVRRVLLDRATFGDEGAQLDAIAAARLGGAR